MKKLRFLTITLICALCLSGCKFISRLAQLPEAIDDSLSAGRTASAQADIIIEWLKTGESEELKEQFCEWTAENYDLDAELEAALEFIDGNITDYGEKRYLSYSQQSIREGRIVFTDVSPDIVEIITDTGKEYKIHFHANVIYKKKPEYVGITYMTIIEEEDSEEYIEYEDKNKIKVGEYPE